MPKVKKETKIEDKKSLRKKSKSHANRGLGFESKINKRLEKLRKEGKLIGFKIPTDWTVIRKGSRIVSAFTRDKSTIDYFGSYQGYFCGIEAKESHNKTSFPIRANIHDHQIKILDELYDNRSLTYYLISFKTLNKMFLVHSKEINTQIQAGVKSLKLEWFVEHGREFNPKEMNFDDYIYLEDIKNIK